MANAPFDVLNTYINTARARLNDKIDTLEPVSGKLIGNTQYFTQQVANTAWRRMQGRLADAGYTALIEEVSISNVPAATSADPLALQSINWTTFFDGTSSQTSPVLPQDFIQPLTILERPHGTNPVSNMLEMERVTTGLPRVPKKPWNRLWEWKYNTIFFPGASVAVDLLIRYGTFYGDFLDTTNPTLNWFEQPVPIMRCEDGFAWYIVAEVMKARGDDPDKIAMVEGWAAAASMSVINRDGAEQATPQKASEMYGGKMTDSRTPKTPGRG